MARVASREELPGRHPTVEFTAVYEVAGRSYAKEISFPWDMGSYLKVGDKLSLRVRDKFPSEAWYGSISAQHYEARLRRTILAVAGLLAIGGIGLVVHGSAGRQSLNRLGNWVFANGKVIHVGSPTKAGIGVTVEYTVDRVDCRTTLF